jgi:hypothetical protein
MAAAPLAWQESRRLTTLMPSQSQLMPRRRLSKITYLSVIAVAMLGWLWLLYIGIHWIVGY